MVVCNFGSGGFGRIGGNLLAIFAAVTEALYLLCGRKAREEMSATSYTTDFIYGDGFLDDRDGAVDGYPRKLSGGEHLLGGHARRVFHAVWA